MLWNSSIKQKILSLISHPLCDAIIHHFAAFPFSCQNSKKNYILGREYASRCVQKNHAAHKLGEKSFVNFRLLWIAGCRVGRICGDKCVERRVNGKLHRCYNCGWKWKFYVKFYYEQNFLSYVLRRSLCFWLKIIELIGGFIHDCTLVILTK